MTDEYLAGFFDGEGCFFLGKQEKNGKFYPKAQILLSQSGPEGLVLLEQIQKEYGGSIYHHLKIGQYKAKKDAYKMWWNREEGVRLIERLLPHLIIKKEAAQTVLTHLKREQC